MAAVVKLVDTRLSPATSMRAILEQMDKGTLTIARMVVVAEADDGELLYFASGARSDLVSAIGLLTTVATRLAMMGEK